MPRGGYRPAECTPITENDKLAIIKEPTKTRLPKLVQARAFKDAADPTKPADKTCIADLIDKWNDSNRKCIAYRSSRTKNALKHDTNGFEISEPNPNQKFITIPSSNTPCLVLDYFDHVLAYKFRVPTELIETLEDSALQLPQRKRVVYSLIAVKLDEVYMSHDYRKDLPDSRDFIDKNEGLFEQLDNNLRLLRPESYKEYTEIDRFLGPDERRLAGAWHGATINRDTGTDEEAKPRKNFKEWPHSLSAMVPFGEYTGGNVKFYNLGLEFELQPGDVLIYNGRVLSYGIEEVTDGYRHSLDLAVQSAVAKSGKSGQRHHRAFEKRKKERLENMTQGQRNKQEKRDKKKTKAEKKREKAKIQEKRAKQRQRRDQNGAIGANAVEVRPAPGTAPIRNLDHLYSNTVKGERNAPDAASGGRQNTTQVNTEPAEPTISQSRPSRTAADTASARIKQQYDVQQETSGSTSCAPTASQHQPNQQNNSSQTPGGKNLKRERESDSPAQPLRAKKIGGEDRKRKRKRNPNWIGQTASDRKAKAERRQQDRDRGVVTGKIGGQIITRPIHPAVTSQQVGRVKLEPKPRVKAEPKPRVKAEPGPRVKAEAGAAASQNTALKPERVFSKITTQIVGDRVMTVECLD